MTELGALALIATALPVARAGSARRRLFLQLGAHLHYEYKEMIIRY
jgi:hypothetical protein